MSPDAVDSENSIFQLQRGLVQGQLYAMVYVDN